jgi:hypothetical protein
VAVQLHSPPPVTQDRQGSAHTTMAAMSRASAALATLAALVQQVAASEGEQFMKPDWVQVRTQPTPTPRRVTRSSSAKKACANQPLRPTHDDHCVARLLR